MLVPHGLLTGEQVSQRYAQDKGKDDVECSHGVDEMVYVVGNMKVVVEIL